MEHWADLGYEWKFTWCGVGTRPKDLPEHMDVLQIWIGHCMALLGGVLCTGDAPGSDTNFFLGYEAGKSDKMPPAQVYYTGKKNQRGLSHNPALGHHELEMYPDTLHIAQDIAYEARGSFEGLYPSGIALHTRNALQVLSEDLKHPRLYTIYCAKPVGKQGLVSGGTNTAVQISRKNKIPTVNLWVEEQRHKFIDWVMRQLALKKIPAPELKGSPYVSSLQAS